MIYHFQLNEALGPKLTFMGANLNAASFDSWFGAAFVLVVSVALFELVRRHFIKQWSTVQEEIEKELKRREALL